jgi:hypothetical protein
MAKFELLERIENTGEIWYFIRKDGEHANNSFTKRLEEAEKMLEEFKKGKQAESITRTIKTIEVDEDNTND